MWWRRLFRLSRREYYADFLITPPMTLCFLLLSAHHGLSMFWLAQFVAGFIAWTFYEYVTHRWLLHWLWKPMHAMHHDDQNDYIALHPALTLLLYATSWALFGLRSSAAMVGFSVGYICYSILHTAFHFTNIRKGNLLFSLKRHHALHHKFNTANYGVSTTMWDSLFGTRR